MTTMANAPKHVDNISTISVSLYIIEKSVKFYFALHLYPHTHNDCILILNQFIVARIISK